MGQLASDNFNRADSNPINGNWAAVTNANQFQIVSHLVEPITASASTIIANISTAAPWPNNQYSEITLSNLGDPANFGGVCVRMNSTANGYVLLIPGLTNSGTMTPVQVLIQKQVNGVGTTLATSGNLLIHSGDVFRLSVVGNQLTAYWNGVQVLTATDSTYSSGSAGLAGFYQSTSGGIATIQISLWAGGSLGVSKFTPGSGTADGAGTQIFATAMSGVMFTGLVNKKTHISS